MSERMTLWGRSHRRSATLLALALLGSASAACSGSDEEIILGVGGARPRGASVAMSSSVASTAISTSSLSGYFDDDEEDAGDPCLPKPLPPGVPEGWVEYLDWSCTCRFYVPGSKEAMPPPIAWEPCPDLPGGIQCKAMVTDWAPQNPTPIAIGNPQFDHNPDGSAVLGIRRIMEKVLVNIIADVDGEVRTAILTKRSTKEEGAGCYLITESVNEGKYLYAVHGHVFDDKVSNHEGAIGGVIGDPKPTVVQHFDYKGPFQVGWSAGAKWIMKMVGDFRLKVLPWDASREIFVTSPSKDPDGEAAAQPLVRGDAIFWNTTSLHQNGINIWTKAGGTRPFIRWVGERTKGADALGTDGVDMVWAYGEGKRPGDTIYTPPLGDDVVLHDEPRQTQAEAPPVASYDTIGNEQFKVGCGYAAHLFVDQKGVGVMVIRLSDGVAWQIPYTPEFKNPTVLGVTCDEVFFLNETKGRSTIARVRIDSLGPGLPPD